MEEVYVSQDHAPPITAVTSGQSQTAWLIEWPATKHEPVRYWHASEPRMLDAHDATWLVRRQDAEAVIKRDGLFGGARAVEHIFGLTIPQDHARPIAADPDLLEALKVILDGLIASREDIGVDDWIEIAAAAISKATGEQP